MSGDPRICLVTGAERGIGRAVAWALASMGHCLMLATRDADGAAKAQAEFREAGFDATAFPMDIRRADEIAAVAARVEGDHGRLDVLVNNAGILVRSGLPPSRMDLADLRATLETNLLGSIAVLQGFVPLLKKGRSARVVNMSSGLGSISQCADPLYEYAPYKTMAYSVSKAALNSATVLFAEELRPFGIKVNAADPGHCATDFNNHTGKRSAEQGAAIAVKLATLPDDGPTGGFYDERGRVPW
jgi:NAD(P)-dependent dehydrogenase (short-subunit alcohol dehydrogenase family)